MSMEEEPGATDPESSDGSATAISVPARITLFGFDVVPAEARIEARSVGWRARRASMALAVGLMVAPVVALAPPHVPWALAALGISVLAAVRRWGEKHTLHSLEGACPRCGKDVSIAHPSRLRHPHPTSCPSCQNELAISVDL